MRAGDGYTVIVFRHDISQRKRAEEALRVSEERYRLAAEATNDILYDWDIRANELEAYESYSPLFLSTTFMLCYGLSFASIISVLVHTGLFHGKELWIRFRSIGKEEEDAEEKEQYGAEAARKIVNFSLCHLHVLTELARSIPGLRAESQIRKVQFVYAFFREKDFQAASKELEELKRGMPELADDWDSRSGKALQEVRDSATPHQVTYMTAYMVPRNTTCPHIR